MPRIIAALSAEGKKFLGNMRGDSTSRWTGIDTRSTALSGDVMIVFGNRRRDITSQFNGSSQNTSGALSGRNEFMWEHEKR